MKKILLLTLALLLLGQLNAQNWRPFNSTDTVRHYLAEDSTDRHITFYPLLSLVIDTQFVKNSISTKVFKKGFSYLKANGSNYAAGAYSYQLIKGKILGDTIRFYQDSTVINSVDPRGFKLHFPARYSNGLSWQLGTTSKQYLSASVDSIYFGNISASAQDSLVSISLHHYDSSMNPISSSSFNQSIILSKHNGLVKTIDFTDLDVAYTYQVFDWKSNDNVFLKHEEHISLTTGDYYYSLKEDSTFRFKTVKHSIFQDVSAGSIRTVGIERQHSAYFFSPSFPRQIPNPPSTFQANYLDTVYYQLTIDSNYRAKESGIVNDSDRVNWQYNQYNAFQYGFQSKQGERFFVSLKDLNLEISRQSIIPFSPPDSIKIKVFQTSGVLYPIYGLGNQQNTLANLMGSFYNTYEEVFFFQKGNYRWGNEPIIVGLNQLAKNESLIVFPNPTTGTLFISDAKKITIIRIFDQSGRQVKQWDNSRNKLNISEFPNGLYFISLQTQTGELINQKFVKR